MWFCFGFYVVYIVVFCMFSVSYLCLHQSRSCRIHWKSIVYSFCCSCFVFVFFSPDILFVLLFHHKYKLWFYQTCLAVFWGYVGIAWSPGIPLFQLWILRCYTFSRRTRVTLQYLRRFRGSLPQLLWGFGWNILETDVH